MIISWVHPDPSSRSLWRLLSGAIWTSNADLGDGGIGEVSEGLEFLDGELGERASKGEGQLKVAVLQLARLKPYNAEVCT